MVTDKKSSKMYAYKKVRKHVSQMSSNEKDKIRDVFKVIKSWEVFDHVYDRIEEKGYTVTDDDFLRILTKGKIIEYEQKYYYNIKKLNHLVVLQSIRKRKGKPIDRMHMVFDITDRGVVSVWINELEDTHETLNLGIYSKGLKVGEKYWQK